MKYRLEFYDNYYKEKKAAMESSMYDLLNNWGCWLSSKFWIIYKGRYVNGNFYPIGIVGRSSSF